MRKRNKYIAKTLLVMLSSVSFLGLIRAYLIQERALNVCQVAFGKLLDHNGYIEVAVTRQHATDEFFDAEAFLYYPAYQKPPDAIELERSAGGRFGSSISNTSLVPFSKGKAFPKFIAIGLPTPGTSHRWFPFDSPFFSFILTFKPSIQPKVVRIVNRTDSFIPISNTLNASWNEPGQLNVSVQFHRDPFVQTAVVIPCGIAIAFAVLLSRLDKLETLTTATASYFISLWSVRGIVGHAILSFPTIFDTCLFGITILVLLIVMWRSIDLAQLFRERT